MEERLKGSLPEEGDGRIEQFNKSERNLKSLSLRYYFIKKLWRSAHLVIFSISDRDFMLDTASRIVKKRRAEKDKEDRIFLDSLLETSFIDEEEVCTRANETFSNWNLPVRNWLYLVFDVQMKYPCDGKKHLSCLAGFVRVMKIVKKC